MCLVALFLNRHSLAHVCRMQIPMHLRQTVIVIVIQGKLIASACSISHSLTLTPLRCFLVLLRLWQRKKARLTAAEQERMIKELLQKSTEAEDRRSEVGACHGLCQALCSKRRMDRQTGAGRTGGRETDAGREGMRVKD